MDEDSFSLSLGFRESLNLFGVPSVSIHFIKLPNEWSKAKTRSLNFDHTPYQLHYWRQVLFFIFIFKKRCHRFSWLQPQQQWTKCSRKTWEIWDGEIMWRSSIHLLMMTSHWAPQPASPTNMWTATWHLVSQKHKSWWGECWSKSDLRSLNESYFACVWLVLRVSDCFCERLFGLQIRISLHLFLSYILPVCHTLL